MEIEKIIYEAFEDIGISINLRDINSQLWIDSLQFVSLLLYLEEKLNVTFTKDNIFEFSKLQTINDFILSFKEKEYK